MHVYITTIVHAQQLWCSVLSHQQGVKRRPIPPILVKSLANFRREEILASVRTREHMWRSHLPLQIWTHIGTHTCIPCSRTYIIEGLTLRTSGALGATFYMICLQTRFGTSDSSGAMPQPWHAPSSKAFRTGLHTFRPGLWRVDITSRLKTDGAAMIS